MNERDRNEPPLDPQMMNFITDCADKSISHFLDTFTDPKTPQAVMNNGRANLAFILATRCLAAAAVLDGKQRAGERLQALVRSFEKWDMAEEDTQRPKRT